MDLNSGCPDDYEELFCTYFPLLRKVARDGGIAPEDWEDVATNLLTDFMDRGGLGWYDPNYVVDTGDAPRVEGDRYRKAKFSNMLKRYATLRVRHYRDKQEVRHRREPWRLEAPIGNSETTWAESEAYGVEMLEPVETSVTIMSVFDRSRDILITRSTAQRDYARFCDLFEEQVRLDGCPDRRTLQAELGVSPSTVTQMLRDLRSTMALLLADSGLIREDNPAPEPEQPEPTPVEEVA